MNFHNSLLHKWCFALITMVGAGFFLVMLSDCQGQVQLTQIQKDSLSAVYEQRLKKFLQKSPSLSNSLKINPQGIYLYTLEKGQKKAALALSWEQAVAFRGLLLQNPQKAYSCYLEGKIGELSFTYFPETPPKPALQDKNLQGIKIALDPGHLAGNMQEAIREGKYVQMNLPHGQKISIFESELAWYTSRILGDTLEKLGAEVILTREKHYLSALDSTYRDWFENYRQKHPDKPLDIWTFFHKEFKKLDFEKRIEKINEFQPDLTLIIHYNVDATNTGWKKPSLRNNSMAFVGGSFMQGELEKPEDQFNFLRLLLSEDIPQSMAFSRKMLQALANELSIQAIPEPNEQFFLDDYCLYTGEPGVYHRNLTLTRRVYGVLCYMEPLYQDNSQECLRLNDRDLEYQGEKIPSRVREVALSYLKGILDYLGE